MLNCWLQYVLSQPVDIDIYLIFIFLLQFLGFSKLPAMVEQACLYSSTSFQLLRQKAVSAFDKELAFKYETEPYELAE